MKEKGRGLDSRRTCHAELYSGVGKPAGSLEHLVQIMALLLAMWL